MAEHQDNDPLRKWLTRGSLAAGIAYTATAEYELAVALGAVPAVAVMLPLAVDAYVVAALRWFRAIDIALSLGVMATAQVAAHATARPAHSRPSLSRTATSPPSTPATSAPAHLPSPDHRPGGPHEH